MVSLENSIAAWISFWGELANMYAKGLNKFRRCDVCVAEIWQLAIPIIHTVRSRNVRCQSAEIEPLATSKNIEFQSEYESIKAFRVFTSSNKVLRLPNYWVDRRLITATSRCASTRCVKRNEFLFEFQFAILRFSHTKPSQLRRDWFLSPSYPRLANCKAAYFYYVRALFHDMFQIATEHWVPCLKLETICDLLF